MFLFLLKNKKRKHRRKRKSEDKSKHRKDNSRLIFHNRHKNEAVRNSDDFLKSSDKRKKHLFEALRTDGSLVQMRSLSSTDRSGRTQIRTHFIKAQKTPTCIRREVRRRVLFASGLAGKIKVRQAKWTEDSKVVCK